MPRFDDEDMQSQKIGGSGYGFSGKRLDALDATSEWTICDFEFDMSGSVDCFAAEIERCAIEAIRSCKHSPRADNLMLRTQTFNHALHEVHGFRPLGECDEAKYVGIIQPGGGTALFDAIHNGASALNKYGADLVAAKYTANGILIVVTDGCENGNSSATALMCKKAIEGARAGEKLESLITILVGINVTDPFVADALKKLAADVGFTQYIEAKDASAKTLARLAAFISKSVSSQSQSLGSGGPSQAQNF